LKPPELTSETNERRTGHDGSFLAVYSIDVSLGASSQAISFAMFFDISDNIRQIKDERERS